MTVQTVTLWVCDQCGYYRSDKSTGRHQTSDPTNPRGQTAVHDLKPVTFTRDPNQEDDAE